ncbi:unnamed protein product [Ixodes persulcatus]
MFCTNNTVEFFLGCDEAQLRYELARNFCICDRFLVETYGDLPLTFGQRTVKIPDMTAITSIKEIKMGVIALASQRGETSTGFLLLAVYKRVVDFFRSDLENKVWSG